MRNLKELEGNCNIYNMADIFALNRNIIELHYWFDDESHAIDAIVFNKCEYGF